MSLVPLNDLKAPTPQELESWRAGFDTAPARRSLELVGARADEAEDSVHGPRTRQSYDYWWDRFVEWLGDPEKRTVGRSWPTTPLSVFGTVVGSETADDLIFAWLSEKAYGPEDEGANALWLEDGGSVSPNTLSIVVAALKARIPRLIDDVWVPGSKLEKRIKGMRRHCRAEYGSDVKAFALVTAQVAMMAAYLSAAEDEQLARDRAVLELSVAGVGAAEIARCSADAVRSPSPGVNTTDPAVNEQLYRDAGLLGMRTLVVPGQGRRGGARSPSRLIPLTPHSPVTVAVDAYLAVVGEADDDDDPWLIRGITADNRRACIREMLIGVGKHADGWRPTHTEPAPTGATLTRLREGLSALGDGDIRRRHRDLALLWVGYCAALRRSELLGLNVGDLREVEGMNRYRLRLGLTKTDQEARGVGLSVDGASGDRAGTHLDPVAAIRVWLDDLRAIYGVDKLPASTPLWPAIGRDGNTLVLADGRRVTRMSAQSWSERLKLIAARSGAVTDPVDLALISGHSLRRGFVTQAAMLGKTALEIRRITRHRSIDQLAAYVDEVQLVYGKSPVSTDDLILGVFSTAP